MMKRDYNEINELIIAETGVSLDELINSLNIYEKVSLSIINGCNIEIVKSMNEELAKDLNKPNQEEYTLDFYHEDLNDNDYHCYPGGYMNKTVKSKDELKKLIVKLYIDYEDYMEDLLYKKSISKNI